MDLGGWGDDEPAQVTAQAPQAQQQKNPYKLPPAALGQPQVQPQQQPRYAQQPQPYQQQPQYQQPRYAQVPPAGQAAFAPAPKPGSGTYGTPAQLPARKLSEQELKTLLAGKTVTVADGRRLEYGRSGSYQETRNGQLIAVGQYRIRDVSVCVQFTTGLSRCDSFVQSGETLYVEDKNGLRLPARPG